MAEIEKTPANNPKIVQAVEKSKGPVGAGHSNADRSAAIMRWLKSKEKKNG